MTEPRKKEHRTDLSADFGQNTEHAHPKSFGVPNELHFGWRTELPFQAWQDFHNAGVFFLNAGDHENAISSFSKAVEIAPEESVPTLALAKVEYAEGDRNKSAVLFEKLTELTPDDPSVWLTLGYIRYQQQEFAAAIQPLYRAMQLEPTTPETCFYLAESLRKTGRFKESFPLYEKLIPHAKRWPQAIYGFGKALISDGRLADGWDAMEFRKVCTFGTWEMHNLLDWDGKPAPEKTVVAYSEGSIAEQIMFASVLPDLIASVKHCVIECDESLHSLFLRSFPQASVVGLPSEPVNPGTLFVGLQPKNNKPAFQSKNALSKTNANDEKLIGVPLDAQIAFGSMPMYFRRSIQDFPRESAYLKTDNELSAYWEKELKKFGDVLKVGFLWEGSWTDESPAQTRIPLEMMKGLLVPKFSPFRAELPKLKGVAPEDREHPVALRKNSVQWICLQHGSARKDFKKISESWNVKNASLFAEIFQRNLDGMAALIGSLDLVITPPGFMAHLAGALGIPCWVLLPNLCEWRWRMGGVRSDWHPSVRLFRQGKNESWEGLISKTENALEFYLSKFFAKTGFYDEELLQELELDPREFVRAA